MIIKVEDMPFVDNMAYADQNFSNNMPVREVVCTICKYRTMTNLASPRCNQCKSPLIKVVR